MEGQTNLNFSIPTELSLKIDKLLIELKEKGSVNKKTKPELLGELLAIGLKYKSKTK
jgi:hypothetical protein